MITSPTVRSAVSKFTLVVTVLFILSVCTTSVSAFSGGIQTEDEIAFSRGQTAGFFSAVAEAVGSFFDAVSSAFSGGSSSNHSSTAENRTRRGGGSSPETAVGRRSAHGQYIGYVNGHAVYYNVADGYHYEAGGDYASGGSNDPCY